ncbi:MAG: GH36-type glycosyl hydrolase domain-containing protein [Thermomonas sp.]
MDDRSIAATHAPDHMPHAHLLSNGHYRTMLTAVGSGYSQWAGCAITRWREDTTCDPWGSYLYVRDLADGAVWSAGFQPTGKAADAYAVNFNEGRAQIERRDGSITTTFEVLVAADGDGELRRVSLRNDGDEARHLELTSYAELVLAPLRNDASHPAFSKLFVCTEYLPAQRVLLATRRRQTPADQQSIWVAQWLDVEDAASADLEWDTDRAEFIGRGGNLRAPAALADGTRLSGGVGTVLDPIFSLRRDVHIPAGTAVHLQWWTVAADSRDGALALVRQYRQEKDPSAIRQGALQQAQKALTEIGIDAEQARRFQRLASALFYNDSSSRASPELIEKGCGGAPTLWAGGISGDFPVVLLSIESDAGLTLVDELLHAHAFWSGKCLEADLVLLNTASGDAAAQLDDELKARIAAYLAQHAKTDAKPHVFAMRGDEVSDGLASGLSTVARIVLDANSGTLAEQVDALPASGFNFATGTVESEPRVAPRVETLASEGAKSSKTTVAGADLEYFNGYGGFDKDGREYVTIINDGRRPPMPWLNVIANPEFGFTATEAGGGYAWSLNSQQNPITPWANDPVRDPPQDILYVRDVDDCTVWTATASSVRPGDHAGTHVARHGQGYSRFQHHAHGIESDLLQYVPAADGLKIARLRLHNTSGRPRKLSVTAFVQWALAPNGEQSTPYIVTALDSATRALFASNAWRPGFGERVAFMDLLGRQTSHSGDRTEFIGQYGTLDAPAAMHDGTPLSGRVGAGLDPCGALQLQIELGIDGEDEIVFLLGDANDADGARALIRRYRDANLDEVLNSATGLWDDILGTVQVKTPDRAMDLLLNRWLLYQALGCRVWARTAYYQASGAYGFRDQLQDVMAVCVASPGEARKQLIRAAGRQFVEGDVQHWWLPPGGAGVRTRMTDDRLWLPYVAAHYIEVTADSDVLETRQAFLSGDVLKPGQNDAFFKPTTAATDASLYEHCALAIDISLSLGAHGLPLFGTGDWNDGMNRVGEQGKGESTWLGWFLLATIDAFVPHALAHGDDARAQRWQACAANVRKALDSAGWDGKWYLRGYYDDGTPLGSHASSECQIDAIAQSWSVMAGGGDPRHAHAAMNAVDDQLIRRDDKVALLFTPPFDKTTHDPGYIKAYPPGIRENGGQYTHGALWSIFAFAKLGDGDRAAELFALINPIHHSDTREAVERYKVEPFVSAADVYSVTPHVGRGGWTWYSGSGAWLYRAGLEAILGFKLEGAQLRMQPSIPTDWPGFSIAYRYASSRYLIEVTNPHVGQPGSCGISKATLDGDEISVDPCLIPLKDDGGEHRLVIELGRGRVDP